ncbi:SRPBCC domain-containing protein [Cnuibacter sp. UC19_7]|uniref:SRPBCC domain-containing protein n=1 Tax=Cnuibacter sp. UC19_7 TaxID=3350166 RepID=UPI00366F5DD6
MSDDHLATATVQIRATPHEVWAVLTDSSRVPEYMFGSEVETDWTAGSAIVYRGEWEGKAFEDRGEIVLVEEPHRLVMTHFSPTSDDSGAAAVHHTVSYSLEPIGDDRTRVVLTQDHNASEDEATRAEANWSAMLEALRAAVEKDILTD